MKVVHVQEAEGMVLGQDMTQIIPGIFKGVAFRKGHIVKPEDIPRLLDMGKEHLYVYELNNGFTHENDAALQIAEATKGKGIKLTVAKEGKVGFLAETTGLLKVNKEALMEINEHEEAIISSLHSNQLVTKDKLVAAAKIIPLVINNQVIHNVIDVCKNYSPVIQVKPLKRLNVGLVITGNEVYYGRIKDGFGPVIKNKIEEMGSTVCKKIYVPDDKELISNSIKELICEGVDMIAVTGGMSVDPDDVTPMAIKDVGGKLITYGAPTLPGAMFMLAYLNNIPILGLPGCVMYHKSTIFDIVLARILAGEELTRRDISRLGYGGLCVNCPECRYPDCGFGKAD